MKEDDKYGAHPKTIGELVDYIDSLVKDMPTYETKSLIEMSDEDKARMHQGYDDAVGALCKSAVAAFNYIAYTLGASGFQGSFAALQFYSTVMSIEGPFAILKAENYLYPQYDGKIEDWVKKWTPWLKQQSKEKLDEIENGGVDPRVKKRWEDWASK